MKREDIKCIYNKKSRDKSLKKLTTEIISKDIIDEVRKFHRSFPEYEVTPLRHLDNLAKKMGVKNIWIKDESYRFGLNAFKALGASYAIGKYLSNMLNEDTSHLSFEKLGEEETKKRLGNITFVTATDGNHGRGVAWAAKKLGQKSVVYMPKGSSEIRLNNIRKEGAEAFITDLNYDDAVRLANKYAKENNGIIIQDTSWEGYEDIPIWIMQGYTTLIDEAIEQIRAMGEEKPTHVFLQAGVGSFAGAIQGYLASIYEQERPITVIVEPNEAACIFKSAQVNDGQPHNVTGDMPTIMAGLACGEPNAVGWNILRDYSDAYISCPDYISARGMRILGSPIKGDPQIISGESGAVGLGIVSVICGLNDFKDIKERLNINYDSKILLVNTEGDTDPIHYKKIVWDGKNCSL